MRPFARAEREGEKLLPLDLWHSDEMRKRRHNAVAKALKEKPSVEWSGGGSAIDLSEGAKTALGMYRVKDKYTVQVYVDTDGQTFVSCGCLAGSPPIDEATGLPSREAVPCYHAASVLIFIAETTTEATT